MIKSLTHPDTQQVYMNKHLTKRKESKEIMVTMLFEHEQKPGSLNHVVYQFILCMSEA